LVFYWSGLFDASENDYIFDDYIGVLVYSLIGGFYHAETKLAKIYINYQHACSLVPACTAALQLATHAACMARLLRALERECACVAPRSARPTLAEQQRVPRCVGPDP
jgi:hypothetical protein